jgi:multiple sugar transport system substrate-binding protein
LRSWRCSRLGPRQAGSRAGQPVTVVLSGWVSSFAETASLQNAIAAFEAGHPTINVDYRPLDNYQPDMESRFAAGDPPDVFYVDSSVAPDWIAKGYLQPLQGFVTSSGFDTTHFFPVLRRAFEGPGRKPYGFPKDWSPLAMFTNNTLLARAGISAPTRWPELRQAAVLVRAATGATPICLSADWARLLAFVEENGGSFLNDARNAVLINSDAAREAADFYVGLVRDGLSALPETLGSGWVRRCVRRGEGRVRVRGNVAAARARWLEACARRGCRRVRREAGASAVSALSVRDTFVVHEPLPAMHPEITAQLLGHAVASLRLIPRHHGSRGGHRR